MTEDVKKERKVFTVLRVLLAFLIGLVFTQVWHMCSLESFYIEAFLVIVAVVIFPYLTYLRKSFRWLFLVYGTVMLIIFNYIYIKALHSNMFPQFLMTRGLDKPPAEYEIFDIRGNYSVPDSSDKEYLSGHKYGWDLTHWRFCIIETGIEFVPEQSVQDAFTEYMPPEELAETSESFKAGKKDGSREAAKYIRSYAKEILKKADP